MKHPSKCVTAKTLELHDMAQGIVNALAASDLQLPKKNHNDLGDWAYEEADVMLGIVKETPNSDQVARLHYYHAGALAIIGTRFPDQVERCSQSLKDKRDHIMKPKSP